MSNPLRIGRLGFLNLLPLFTVFETEFSHRHYEFIDGVPSQLNAMLRSGKLDVSPSSSIELIRNPELYDMIEGHSISSRGRVESIILFSSQLLAELGGKTIHLTHKSETSSALLDIILNTFNNLDCSFKVTQMEAEKAACRLGPYMAIGDDALLLMEQSEIISEHNAEGYSTIHIDGRQLYAYDLGQLWHNKTGLPMVYALWIAIKPDTQQKAEALDIFRQDLKQASSIAQGMLETIAQNQALAPDRLLSYWQSIVYDFPPDCKQGYEEFARYIRQMDKTPLD